MCTNGVRNQNYDLRTPTVVTTVLDVNIYVASVRNIHIASVLDKYAGRGRVRLGIPFKREKKKNRPKMLMESARAGGRSGPVKEAGQCFRV